MKPGPLEELTAASGREFPHLLKARELTRQRLRERTMSLDGLTHDPDVSIVLMGSWGRSEVTRGSDDDFMILVNGGDREDVHPSVEDVKRILDRAPGDHGVFGEPVFSDRVVERIGLETDINSNLTRRMLFLLESVCATREDIYHTVREQLLARYLDESIKDFRPPRFLLNDVIRYWRTICVDFAGKEHESPQKWGIRNAKLRTSRKVLFAGGLLPVFECANLERELMPDFLREQLQMPPTDRIAGAFLNHGAADPGGRALGAYDDFIGLLDDPGFRTELETVTRDQSEQSTAFGETARLGKELERGLLALLFETATLSSLVRSYAIF
jgi:hypothetical protein